MEISIGEFPKFSVIYVSPPSAVWRKCRCKQQENRKNDYFFQLQRARMVFRYFY